MPPMDEQEALALLGLDQPTGGEPPAEVRARLSDEGDVVAEVAASLQLARRRGRLVRFEQRSPGGRDQPVAQMLCVLFGPLVQTPDLRLGFGSLEVGPIVSPHAIDVPLLEGIPMYEWRPDPVIPVTAGLFRLFSLERIVAAAVSQLRSSEYWHQVAEKLGKAEPMSDRQQAAYARLRRSRVPGARPTEREIELIARRYLQLVGRGMRHPLRQIADEIGLSREQVRDRLHRARSPKLGYLEPARPGRVSAEPGPRLLVSTQLAKGGEKSG